MCNFTARDASNRVACKQPKIMVRRVLGSDEDPRIPLTHGQVLLRWANRGKRYGI
jgi:hypothetical protein